MFKEMGEESESLQENEFVASKGWFEKLANHHNLSLRPSSYSTLLLGGSGLTPFAEMIWPKNASSVALKTQSALLSFRPLSLMHVSTCVTRA